MGFNAVFHVPHAFNTPLLVSMLNMAIRQKLTKSDPIPMDTKTLSTLLESALEEHIPSFNIPVFHFYVYDLGDAPPPPGTPPSPPSIYIGQ